MYKLWFDIETDPDSDFQNDYLAKVINHLKQYAVDHPRNFTFSYTEDYRNYNEFDTYELWFARPEHAVHFRLSWPFRITLVDDR